MDESDRASHLQPLWRIPGVPLPRCFKASMPWCLISRTLARGFIPISRPWRYCMEAAAKGRHSVLCFGSTRIPIGGVRVEGPMLDPDKTSFTGYMPLPVRHGMTVGELARYFNAEKKIGVQLHVVPMKGWLRSYYFWDTGQLWVNPSPNMRTMMAAILYPGVCLLESANVSVGRGTDRPFEIAGSAMDRAAAFGCGVRQKPGFPGVKAVPVFFTPNADKYQGKKCGGVSLTVTDTDRLNSVLLGLSLISILHQSLSR